MLWVVFIAMVLIAAVFVTLPVYRQRKRFSAEIIVAAVFVVAMSAGLYSVTGSPDAESGRAELASIDDMVESLAARLAADPEDLEGWKMLGRSYLQLGDPAQAIAAFERAVALENSSNGDTLVSLGEAMLQQDREALGGRAGQLFESGLAVAPNNPRGLFYGGLTAERRGDTALAATRWEALLALSPPPEIENVLRQRIAVWRGEPQPAMAPAGSPATSPAGAEPVVTVDISVDASAAGAFDPAASVFVIARDPAQPRPPIAVARRKAGELPGRVALGDDNAMVPGRVPSAFEELEIVVRVSASGQPIAQAGDWFGEALVRPGETRDISVVIDRQVQ